MSNPYILYSKMSHVTGRRLCQATGFDGGRSLDKIGDYTHLLRWGCTYAQDLDIEMDELGRRVYNRANNARVVVNRHHMMQQMQNYDSSLTLPFNSYLAWDPYLDDNRMMLLRHRFGRWGRDIVRRSVHDQPPDPAPRWDGYFTVVEWLADYEVRVHIVNGASASFQVKVPKDDEGNPVWTLPDESAEFVIRNDRNGWHLYPLSNRRASELGISKANIRTHAKQLMSYLDLDYGAVDFLVRVPSGHHGTSFDYKLLEVNSAPGLDGATLDRYADHFQSIVSGDPVTVSEEDDEDEEFATQQTANDVFHNVPDGDFTNQYRRVVINNLVQDF